MEIERKFLVAKLPPELLQGNTGERIDQGYLINEDGCELRLRRRNKICYLTSKLGQGLQRQEQEHIIDTALFAMLWPFTRGRRIEKTRYCVPDSGHLLEIDIFHGQLAPLILLEVEFDSIAVSGNFTPPGFASAEVTDDRAYTNAQLTSGGLPTGQHLKQNTSTSDRQASKGAHSMTTDIEKVSGIGPATAVQLKELGVITAEDLAATNIEKLAGVHGFSNIRAEQVITAAQALTAEQATLAEETAPIVKAKKVKKEKNKKKDSKKDKCSKKDKVSKMDKKPAKSKKKAEPKTKRAAKNKKKKNK
jgi:CYTH domain-containing protein